MLLKRNPRRVRVQGNAPTVCSSTPHAHYVLPALHDPMVSAIASRLPPNASLAAAALLTVSSVIASRKSLAPVAPFLAAGALTCSAAAATPFATAEAPLACYIGVFTLRLGLFGCSAWLTNSLIAAAFAGAVRSGRLVDTTARKLHSLSNKVSTTLLAVLALELVGIHSARALLTVGGGLGLFVAIGMRETASNLISAISVLLRKRFIVGDKLQIGSRNPGTVEEVDLGGIVLRDASQVPVYISHATLSKEVYANLSRARAAAIRVTVPVSRTKVMAFTDMLQNWLDDRRWLWEDSPIVRIDSVQSESATVTAHCFVHPDSSETEQERYRQEILSYTLTLDEQLQNNKEVG